MCILGPVFGSRGLRMTNSAIKLGSVVFALVTALSDVCIRLTLRRAA